MLNTIKTTLSFSLLFFSFMALASQPSKELTAQLTLKNANNYTNQHITGGQPSIADLDKLAKADVKIVINLRGNGEFSAFNEREVVERLGMTYISLPIASAEDINVININKFHQLLGSSDSRTLVHCASGNRVGAFFALEAHQFGNKSKAEAITIGKKTGLTRLENKVFKIIDSTL
jgi:uncharacterized protein (TIGR01244 family)